MAKTPTDKESTAPDDEKKLEAFTAVARQLSGLSQADKYAVLNAAAKFHGLSIELK